jgi:hypothetical protein
MIGARMIAPKWARGGGLIRPAALAVALLVFLLAVGRLVPEPTHVREVVALSVIVLIAGVGAYSPPLLLPALALWLAGLGLVRRLVTEVGVPNKLDPLLLVGPLGLGLLTLWGIRRTAGRPPTNLMKAILVLSALILLGALNPRGGSLFGGTAGLLFVLVPTFGYWVGRAVDDRVLSWTLKLVATLGLVAATYGILQTTAGFPSWDRHWIDQVSFASLNVNGVIRPFASFTSAQEYALYLAIVIVIWIGAAFRTRYLVLSGLAVSLLIPALVLESSRGAIVSLLVAIGAMLGARRRLPLLLAAGVGVALLAALTFGLRSFGPSTSPSAVTTSSGQLISHDVAGLSDPLNPQASTVGVHLSLVVDGVRSAFSDPIGRGIGAVTIAGRTFGGVTSGTEADPSNLAVALGLPGLIAYLFVLVLGVRVVYRTACARRDPLALIALGIVTVTFLQWFNGGLYSVAFLPWLAMGWADSADSGAHLQAQRSNS